MTKSKRKALTRAPKSNNKKYLDELKRIHGLRKAFVDLSIQIDKNKR